MTATQQLHNLMMLDHADQKLAMNRKHLDAYRREGLAMPAASDREDDMRILSSGDVHVSHSQPAPASPSPGGGIGNALVGVAIGAALSAVPAAGVAGYLLHRLSPPAASTNPAPPSQRPSTDTSLDIGLKHFEDLLQDQ